MVSVPLNQFVMPRPRPALPGEMPPGTAVPPGQELLFQAPQQPGLLQRLMGGVQPQAAPGAERMGLLGRLTDPQAGWRGKVADNAQALTGFGLGLLSGQGNRDAYGRALQGWQSGSAMDADRQNTEWSRDWMADERDYTRGRQAEADAMSRTRFGWEGQDREAAARQRQAEMANAEATRNQTRDWLISRGYSEAEVPAIMANPSVLGEIMKGAYGAGGGSEYGLTPVYGTDADGNPVLMQMSKSGGVRPVDLPEGVTAAPGVQRVDLGTEWGVMDRGGNLVGRIPKDLAGAERDKAMGKAEGDRIAMAPADIQQAEAALQAIDGLLADPRLIERGTGASGMLLNRIPGRPERGFQARVDQLKGQTFLEAYKNLRGGGQITEVEGQKAEQAIARLDVAQSAADFTQALNDLREVVDAGLSRARARAGSAVPEGIDPTDFEYMTEEERALFR